MPTEPYLLGSHSGCCGLWTSGPDYDWVPDDYKIKARNGKVYKQMTTVEGLFTAGDGVGGSGHKFSSGSHAEGRIAVKQMCRYAGDFADFKPELPVSAAEAVELMKAGKPAAEVVNEYEAFVQARGFQEHLLYGPCHGIGMMEVERPWMESTSTYDLQTNMTFQVDTFFYAEDFGLRWENGVRITDEGVERLSEKYIKLVQL